MNNSRYYNDSLAYDFEMFMPKKKEQQTEIIKMPSSRAKRNVRNRATKKVSRTFSIILLGAFIVSCICANIALRVEISEANSKIHEAKTTLAALSGEETRLNIQFESIISYTNLEEAAKAIGMKKMSKNQIVYIRVNDQNKAVDKNGNILTIENE